MVFQLFLSSFWIFSYPAPSSIIIFWFLLLFDYASCISFSISWYNFIILTGLEDGKNKKASLVRLIKSLDGTSDHFWLENADRTMIWQYFKSLTILGLNNGN